MLMACISRCQGRQAVEGIGYTERAGADGNLVRIELAKGRREELHTPLDDTTYFVVRGRDWANRGMSFEPLVTDGRGRDWHLHAGVLHCGRQSQDGVDLSSGHYLGFTASRISAGVSCYV